MTQLREHQFEILPNDLAQDGFVFGLGAEVAVEAGGFDPGSKEWISQDTQNGRRGVNNFGRDVPGANTWIWSSFADRNDVEEAADTLDRFSSAWHPEEVSLESGATTSLRYRLAGRDRRVFGRPRNFAAPPTNLILNGMVGVTHDFKCVDSYTYSDLETSHEIPYASAATGGGFVLPAVFPVSGPAGEGSGSSQLAIGGTARAYPRIRLKGPWTNPVVVTDHWALRWEGEIPALDWVEVNALPWKLTVLWKDGSSAVDGLPRTTWLEDIWFPAGSRPQVSLGGSAASGGASATIAWRDTWTSI